MVGPRAAALATDAGNLPVVASFDLQVVAGFGIEDCGTFGVEEDDSTRCFFGGGGGIVSTLGRARLWVIVEGRD